MALNGVEQRRLMEAGEDVVACRLTLVNAVAFRRPGHDADAGARFVRECFAEAVGSYLGTDDFFFLSGDNCWIFFLGKRPESVRSIAGRIAAKVPKLLMRRAAFHSPAPECAATLLDRDEALRLAATAAGRDLAEDGAVAALEPDAAESEAWKMDYAPLWQIKTGHVVGCVCRPQIPPAFVSMLGDDDYYEATDERMAFDLAAFDRTVADLIAFRGQGGKTVVVFPLNFRTFCTPDYGRRYMSALRAVPAALAGFLMPKFVRVPEGAPQSLIAEKIASLAPLFKHVLVQTPPNARLSRFEYTSCAILTTSWRDVARLVGGTPSHADAVGVLDQFCRFASGRGLRSAVEGADTLPAVEAAMAARADFVAGGAIGPPDRALIAQKSLTIEDIRAARRAL